MQNVEKATGISEVGLLSIRLNSLFTIDDITGCEYFKCSDVKLSKLAALPHFNFLKTWLIHHWNVSTEKYHGIQLSFACTQIEEIQLDWHYYWYTPC